MTEIELKKRFKDWAISVVLFTKKFPKGQEFNAVRGQIVRSAPSAAANYRAACRGKSTPDFINKLKIVEEELDESMFWLEFVVALAAELPAGVVPLYKEANDFNTQELARAFAVAVHERTGCWPHVIFNKLHRRKLDANREIVEAAQGNKQGVRDNMQNVLRFADSLSVTLLKYLDLHYFADASDVLCHSDTASAEPPMPDFLEIFPNPYCVHFFVKITSQAPAGNWICEVYDFYGNLLRTNSLDQEQAIEIAPRNRENVIVVLRRDGEIAAIRAVLRSCR